MDSEEIKPRVFVTSDTHGCAKELHSCLMQADFQYETDTLIHLGDCVDRGPDSKGVIDLLLKCKNLIAIRGNHDQWFLEFIQTGVHPGGWHHGALRTRTSYAAEDELDEDRALFVTACNVPKAHREFFENQIPHYTDEQKRFFCHGGFNRHKLVSEQEDFIFMWDRDLWLAAMSAGQISVEDSMTIPKILDLDGNIKLKDGRLNFRIKDGFKKVFVGHTPTINWKKKDPSINMMLPIEKPMYTPKVVNIDTGGCFGGAISLLDITDDENHILYQARIL